MEGVVVGRLSPVPRVFNLADYVQIKDAPFRDGLLTVELAREIPEAMKPRRIAINGASASQQIDQKKAA
jgi:molecular chaperone IbpA